MSTLYNLSTISNISLLIMTGGVILILCICYVSYIKMKQQPPDIEEIGRASWTMLHTTAAKYPDNPTEKDKKRMTQLIDSLSGLYPCEKCKYHLAEYIKENPVKTENKQNLQNWLCTFHNSVNERIGKDKFDCNIDLENRWGSQNTCSENACSL